jgi:hypothetical protein
MTDERRPTLWHRVARPWSRVLLSAVCLLPAGGWAASWVVGPDGAPMTLQDAVAQAKDGDVIEMIQGQYRAPIVLENRQITLRGVGPAVIVGGEAKVALGRARALWTVRGGQVTLENIQFRGARSQEGAGAGVRQEGGRLTVRQCQFFDNEHGLTTTNDEAAELLIENSVFGAAPRVPGGLYHLLNVGRIGKLGITGSRFQQGFEGHLIRTRARENFIAYNLIHDGQRGGASYEIEIVDGGMATILGNVIAQGAEGQNPVLVAYGSEGRAWPQNELRLSHNTFINYAWTPAWFLRVFKDRLPAGFEVFAVNNLLVGPGIFWLGAPGTFEGNRVALRGMLRDAPTYFFELPPDSMWRGSGVDPTRIEGRDLSPQAEYEWPIGTRKLEPGRTQWSPGAFQR